MSKVKEKYPARGEDGKTVNERAEEAAGEEQEVKLPTFAPPKEEHRTPEPRPHDWENALRELPRERMIMLEDFGMTKSALAKWAEKARQGDEEAIEKLEPLRHCFLDLMGTTLHERPIKDDDCNFIMIKKPTGRFTPAGEEIFDYVKKTETRSRWGWREGPDLNTKVGRRPRPRQVYDKVNEHFYSLIQVCEFLRKAAPRVFHGRKHPNPEQFAESHAAAIDAENNPERKAALEFTMKYLSKELGGQGKSHEWNGED